MIFASIAAAALELQVVAVLPEAGRYGNSVEIVERPAGIQIPAFVDQVIAHAGAGEWQRIDGDNVVHGVKVRMLAMKNGAQRLMLYIPKDEDGPAVCRVTRLAALPIPAEERRRIDGFCVDGIRYVRVTRQRILN